MKITREKSLAFANILPTMHFDLICRNTKICICENWTGSIKLLFSHNEFVINLCREFRTDGCKKLYDVYDNSCSYGNDPVYAQLRGTMRDVKTLCFSK